MQTLSQGVTIDRSNHRYPPLGDQPPACHDRQPSAHDSQGSFVSRQALQVVGLTAAKWLSEQRRPTARPLTTDDDELDRAARRGAVVWDIRPTLEHERDRPPRALSLGAVDWVLAVGGDGRLTGRASIARVLGRIGIGPGRAVIVYGGRAAAGFLALRALRSIGVESASIYLNARHPRQDRSGTADPPDAGVAQRHLPRIRRDG